MNIDLKFKNLGNREEIVISHRRWYNLFVFVQRGWSIIGVWAMLWAAQRPVQIVWNFGASPALPLLLSLNSRIAPNGWIFFARSHYKFKNFSEISFSFSFCLLFFFFLNNRFKSLNTFNILTILESLWYLFHC